MKRPFYHRLAVWGFLLIAASFLVSLAAGNVIGAVNSPGPEFGAAMIVVALVVARWRRALYPAAAIALVTFAVLGLLQALELTHPQSFSDFVPAVIRQLGALAALVGSIGGILQLRRDESRPATTGQRRFVAVVGGAFVLIAILSAVLTYVTPSNAHVPAGFALVVLKGTRFRPDVLHVSEGQELKILARNEDSFAHTFTIDALGIDEYIGPGADRAITFRASSQSKDHPWLDLSCRVTGHDAMNGKVYVG